ncbi:MAG: hypothetical protein N0E48_16240, partial [Candidatus Thiodiazotropha endolucinida]|nr:hypothetical protein [Candidatus Thiodiazotropha taylori]MCW4344882.1 hypothetical protein [Candidatus Thiodiazotropha endolucinida]
IDTSRITDVFSMFRKTKSTSSIDNTRHSFHERIKTVKSRPLKVTPIHRWRTLLSLRKECGSCFGRVTPVKHQDLT